jgi:ATP-dependent DNA helicase RecG
LNASLGIVPTLESEVEERKETWQDNGLEALAALANTRGGTLWIGVKDNGDPVAPNGWPDAGVAGKTEAIVSKIVSKLQIHPTSITLETVNGKTVLAIRVSRAPAPVVLNGHYYRRVGNTTLRVEGEDLTRFLLERTGARWDSLPCATNLAALDDKTFEDFKVLAQKRLPVLRPSDDPRTIANNLRLVDDEGRLLRAAVLLFGRDEEAQRLSPTAFVQVGRFKGNGTTILDDRQITGNLFAQLNGVTTALRTYLQVRYEFPTEAGEREGAAALQPIEVWEYPLTALREAVANALLHRDYTSSGRAMIRVYDDRILVSSPGLLPEGLTIADLSRNPHDSRLRNPLLAQAFYFAEIVERWGSGTLRMAEACLAQGLPAPEFEQVGGEFHVTFRKDPYTDERLKALGLSDRQIKGVRLVQENGSISNAEYRDATGTTERTALRDLALLVKVGIVKPSEGGRHARYELTGIKPTNPS